MLVHVSDVGERSEGELGTTTRASSFDRFYATAAPGLVRQLRAMNGGDLAEAQDCVQEAFARAWQRWDRVSGYDAPEAWVRTVAWRLTVSRLRRLRTAALARPRREPDQVPDLSPDHVVLVSALWTLPPDQRRAVVLHHLADLSVEQIADETGVPVGTVKARLSRGRAALAARLRDLDPQEAGRD